MIGRVDVAAVRVREGDSEAFVGFVGGVACDIDRDQHLGLARGEVGGTRGESAAAEVRGAGRIGASAGDGPGHRRRIQVAAATKQHHAERRAAGVAFRRRGGDRFDPQRTVVVADGRADLVRVRIDAAAAGVLQAQFEGFVELERGIARDVDVDVPLGGARHHHVGHQNARGPAHEVGGVGRERPAAGEHFQLERAGTGDHLRARDAEAVRTAEVLAFVAVAFEPRQRQHRAREERVVVDDLAGGAGRAAHGAIGQGAERDLEAFGGLGGSVAVDVHVEQGLGRARGEIGGAADPGAGREVAGVGRIRAVPLDVPGRPALGAGIAVAAHAERQRRGAAVAFDFRRIHGLDADLRHLVLVGADIGSAAFDAREADAALVIRRTVRLALVDRRAVRGQCPHLHAESWSDHCVAGLGRATVVAEGPHVGRALKQIAAATIQ